jgi:hypothetical protein
MALGATPFVAIKDLVLAALRPVLLGMLAGFAASAGVLALLRSILPLSREVSVFSTIFLSPLTYLGLVLIFGVAVVASIIPAGRAIYAEPLVALRHE